MSDLNEIKKYTNHQYDKFWDNVINLKLKYEYVDGNTDPDYEPAISGFTFYKNGCKYQSNIDFTGLSLTIGEKEIFAISSEKSVMEIIQGNQQYIYAVDNLTDALELTDAGITNIVILPEEINGELHFKGKGLTDRFISLGFNEKIYKICCQQGCNYAYLPQLDYDNLYSADFEEYCALIRDYDKLSDFSALRQDKAASKDFSEYKINKKLEFKCKIKTGFENLDTFMCGGLSSGLYIIGAMSGAGKTTFVHQMVQQIVKVNKDQDVIYLNLEMPRLSMFDKAVKMHGFINAIKHKDKNRFFTTKDLFFSEEPETAFTYSDGKSKEQYIDEVIDQIQEPHSHIIYTNKDVATATVDDYIAEIKENIANLNTKPVVVVDYIQILKASNPYLNEKDQITETIMKLKTLSVDYGLVVIVISSLNRNGYTSNGGFTQLSAFKGSGNLEYTADYVFALDFADQDAKDFSFQEAKKQNPRRMILNDLKCRYGSMADDGKQTETIELKYDYYANYDIFLQYTSHSATPYENNRNILGECSKVAHNYLPNNLEVPKDNVGKLIADNEDGKDVEDKIEGIDSSAEPVDEVEDIDLNITID